ncbi:MAG: hypothetical protein H6828_10585 [Planctomycetes bacterium]|nr:hypothetical protein [Planctomycetota bacterium]
MTLARTLVALLALAPALSAQVIGGKYPGGGTTLAVLLPFGTPDCGTSLNVSVPPAQPGGLGMDGTHVWLGNFHGAQLLWKLDPQTGAVVGTLPAPDAHIGGIACAPGALWVAAEQSGMIYRLDPTTGAVQHVIPSPTASDADPDGAGLAWDGAALWQADYRRSLLMRLSPQTGQVLWSIPAPAHGVCGLSWVDGKLLVACFASRGIYQVDPTNGLILGLCANAGQFPWGLAVDPSGSTWVADSNTGRVRLEPTGYDVSRYCFGDDTGTPCPCGNPSVSGAGCANSTGVGALLDADGAPSLTSDALVMRARGLVPGEPALLFAGANAVNGGLGAQFGDGLRCAGGTVLRLGTLAADAWGEASWGPGLLPAGWAAGETRYFQVRYRDPNGPCGSGFNGSNGCAQVLVP